MVKTKNARKWKPISIDPSLNAEGLVGVEECIDYDITTFKNDAQSSKRKRPNTESNNTTKKKKKLSKSVNLTPSKSGSSVETNDEEFSEIYAENWSKFGLPQAVIKALSIRGFKKPTLIQSLTLPAAILGRRNIVGAAETGSGKTLAFGLPIITGILDLKNRNENIDKKPLFALILTPTRELAIQVRNHLLAITKYTDLNVAVVVGGMASVKQERILNKHPEIVVATPGRLWELIKQGNAHLTQIDNVKYLAIDETDRMLEKGHFEELYNILERLNNEQNEKKRQTFVFSATLSLVHDLPKYLYKKSKASKLSSEQKLQKIIDTLGVKNPKIVDITQGKNITPESLTESRISCAIDEKDYYVYYFLQKYPGRTLIFCNSIGCVKRLTNLLSCLGCKPLPLHASLQQKQRLKNLDRFRENENGILIATDVAARGLDIPKIEHVLHYQTPRTSESYIHRSGRTARNTQKGITVLLMDPSEIQNYFKLCKTLNKSEDVLLFPIQEDYLKAVKERVNLAREVDKLELEIRKNNSEKGWLQKAAKEMDIIVEDDFNSDNSDVEDGASTSKKKKLAEMKRKQLNTLLAKPVFPRGFTGKYPLNLGEFFPKNETAIEIMEKTPKKKNIPLFKLNKNKIH